MDTIPTGGTFVVFTLDLVASVAHLENQELTAACRELELSQDKYVAYVRRVCLFPDCHKPYAELYLLGQGQLTYALESL